jgi:hypothetical protein
MASFVARGVVPQSFRRGGFRLPVENGRALDSWWKANRIETHCDRKDACTPLVAIRGEAARKCKPGQLIQCTLEVVVRRSGRGIGTARVEELVPRLQFESRRAIGQ